MRERQSTEADLAILTFGKVFVKINVLKKMEFGPKINTNCSSLIIQYRLI